MPPRTRPTDPRPVKDRQTITPEGDLVRPLIEGVVVRPAQTIEDRRGEIVELYRPSWGLHPDPLVFVYQVLIRPGAIKGWVVHERQDDRLFMSTGGADQDLARGAIAGFFDNDAVAAIDEQAAHQIQRLLHAVDDQNLLGTGHDPTCTREIMRDRLTQRSKPPGSSVP